MRRNKTILAFCFVTFSSREPVPTSLENALGSRLRGNIAFEPFLLLGNSQQTVAHFHQALIFIAARQRILGAGIALSGPAAQFGGG